MSLHLTLGMAIILLAGCAYYPAGYDAAYDATYVVPYSYPYHYGYGAGYGYYYPRHYFYYDHHSHGHKTHPYPYTGHDRFRHKGEYYDRDNYQNRPASGGQSRNDGHGNRQGFTMPGRGNAVGGGGGRPNVQAR